MGTIKRRCLCLGLCLILCQGQVLARPKTKAKGKTLVLNGQVLKEGAISYDKKTKMPLVPLRYLADRLALETSYQYLGSGKGRIGLRGNGKSLFLDLGNRKVQIEEWSSGAVYTKRTVNLSREVVVISGKTYVPLDLFSRVLNYQVSQSKDKINIVYKEGPLEKKGVCKSTEEALSLLERAARARKRVVGISYENVDLEELIHRIKNHLGPQEGISSISYVDRNQKDLVFTLDYRSSDRQVDQTRAYVKDWVKKNIQQGDNDLEKIRKIHDEVLQKASFYNGQDRFLEGVDVHTAEGIIYRGQAVCQGYAQLVYVLCQEAGLEAYLVPGPAKMGGREEPHAWNLVKINGAWYHLDATWDDALVQDPYRFFLKGDATMAKTRSWSDFFPRATKDYQ